MASRALQLITARTEDRALLRSNLSAVPGAKTEGRAMRPPSPSPTFPSGLAQSDKPSRHDAASVTVHRAGVSDGSF
jgi:hypothetical protein